MFYEDARVFANLDHIIHDSDNYPAIIFLKLAMVLE